MTLTRAGGEGAAGAGEGGGGRLLLRAWPREQGTGQQAAKPAPNSAFRPEVTAVAARLHAPCVSLGRRELPAGMRDAL